MYNTDQNIGALSNIVYSKGLVFAPSEIDMSIRPGWFYRDTEQAHSLERLFDTYLNSVGANTTFNLNVPPMPNGKLNDDDVKRLNELGELIKNSFKTNLAEGKEITIEPYNGSETQRVITIELGERMKLNFLELSENIAEGQRVENFIVQHRNEDKIWFNSFEGTTIGTKKIIKLHGLETDAVRILMVSSRDTPEINKIALY